MSTARPIPEGRLHHAMILRGVSVADLAGAAGVSEATVYAALRGRPLSLAMHSRLVVALSRFQRQEGVTEVLQELGA